MYYRVRNSNYQRSGTYISKPKFAEPDAAGVDVKCKGWLMNNSHNTNPLLKSIQEQYSKHLQLTQKQWSIVEAQMNRSNYVAVPKVPVKLGSPIPIMINRTAAFKEIRDKLKLDYGVFAVKINRVLNSGKARNGNQWAELEILPDADTPVSCCRVCGKTLKDHRSIVSGIGPDCAKKFKTIYHSYSTNNLQVFRDDFKKLISKKFNFLGIDV